MTKLKVCKQLGILVERDVKECPLTKSKEFVSKYKGIVAILDVNSYTAEKLEKKHIGVYALKY